MARSTGKQAPMNAASQAIFDAAVKGISAVNEQLTAAAKIQVDAAQKASATYSLLPVGAAAAPQATKPAVYGLKPLEEGESPAKKGGKSLPIMDGVASGGDKMLASVKLVPTALERLQAAVAAAEARLDAVFQVVSPAIEGVGQAFQGMRGAADQLKGGFNSIVSQITPFVQAFNPTAVMMFQAAMRDLNATIGQALVPVMHGATQVIRLFASVLNPVMERLTPIFQELTDMAVEMVDIGMTALAQLFTALEPLVEVFMELERSLQPVREALMQMLVIFTTALQPVFLILAEVLRVLLLPVRLLAEAFNLMMPVLQAITLILSGVGESFKAAIGAFRGFFGSMEKPFESLTTIVKEVTRVLITLLAKLAMTLSAFGGRAFVEGMLRGASGGERKDATGMAAAQNASVTGLDSISRTMTQAALLAGGGAKEKEKPEDIMRDIREDLRAVLGGGDPPWLSRLVGMIFTHLRAEYPGLARMIEAAGNPAGAAEDALRRATSSLLARGMRSR